MPAWTSIVRRAALAALEASEAIQAAGGGRLLVIRGSFDDFNFDLELLQDGEPLRLGGAAAAVGDGSVGAAAAAEAPLDLDALMNSDANAQQLHDNNTPALIADGQMRKRDERFAAQAKNKAKPDPLSEKKASSEAAEIQFFRPKDFHFNDEGNTATCPAAQVLISSGRIHLTARGQPYQTYIAKAADCGRCTLRSQCIKTRAADEQSPPARGRQVSRFLPKPPDSSHPSERMRQAIDSPRGRQLYSQRIGTVEPVFANLRHNKRLSRFESPRVSRRLQLWRMEP